LEEVYLETVAEGDHPSEGGLGGEGS